MARPNRGPRMVMRKGRWYVRWTEDGKTVERSSGTTDHAEAKKFMESLFNPPATESLSGLTQAWQRCKTNAVARGKPFEITLDDVRNIYERSGGQCMVTGIPFDMSTYMQKRGKRPWIPSIDRIDSERGYTLDNIRLVCAAANFAMNWWGEAVLARLARAYTAKRGMLKDEYNGDSVAYLWNDRDSDARKAS